MKIASKRFKKFYLSKFIPITTREAEVLQMHKGFCSCSYFGISGLFLAVFWSIDKKKAKYLLSNNRANEVSPLSYKLAVSFIIFLFSIPISDLSNSFLLYNFSSVVRGRIRYEDNNNIDRSVLRDQNSGQLYIDYPFHVPELMAADKDTNLEDLKVKAEEESESDSKRK